ncbi:hypothetical protein ST47_g2111 [Ascochyta rabiei]|uniref:Uncharacterized protein n=1 Tax=Didymella rabiei TaxID=5454 RepID=A0A163K373_DIDRA|nr:hypothetical protein ST47_g2111 [Ascochyta rabiei]
MITMSPTAPPTPAPIPIIFALSAFCAVADEVADEVADDVLVGALSEVVEPVAVGPNDEVLTPDTDSGADDEVALVNAALVDAPNSAPANVKTAFSVLQHLCLSASLSQQYFASSPYP